MKKKLLFILSLLLVMPTVVKAEITSTTQGIGAHTDAKTQVEDQLKLNGSLNNATNGYYAEGLEIKCSNSTWNYTIMNTSIDSLTCSNGNTNPYKDIVSDGTTGTDITNGGTCDGTESVLYATRIYNFDCNYVNGSTPGSKVDYTSTTTTTNNDTNKDGETTTKDTGTTDNKDTGVEDYFIALGTIGIVVTGLLYVIDKKNVFKKI